MMAGETGRYLAYMVRLWQAGSERKPAWRAYLESPHTGERRAFADLEELFRYLRQQTGSPKGEGVDQEGPPPR